MDNISRSDTGLRSYGPDKMWTDRQGDSYIPPKICLQGGDNKIDFVGLIKITYLHVLIPSEKSESC